MNKKIIITGLICVLLRLVWILPAQQGSVVIKLVGSEKPAIAIPDFRGSGAAAQNLMAALNETLFNDVDSSGLFKMMPKGMFGGENVSLRKSTCLVNVARSPP